jgi:hypothetical protein
LTLRRLASEVEDPKLLLALTNFPNFEFLVRGKEKITLRETIARNINVDSQLINKLISFRDIKIDVALASNVTVSQDILERFVQKDNINIFKALASNRNINDVIFEKLLSKEAKVVELLLIWQQIDINRLRLIQNSKLENDLFALLGANEHLDNVVVEVLLNNSSDFVTSNLAENSSIKASVLEKIYELKVEATFEKLARNKATPIYILEELYKNNIDNKPIVIALSYNSSLSMEMLKNMFDKDDFELNKGLATNASLPMELLDILKVDTRLQNYLAQNTIFIKEYETVLDYDKNAVQF